MTKNANNIYYIPIKRFNIITISIRRRPEFPALYSNFSQILKRDESGESEADFIFNELLQNKEASNKEEYISREFLLKLYVAYDFKPELKNKIQEIVSDSSNIGEYCSFSEKISGLAFTLSSLLFVKVAISVSDKDNSISMFVF